MTFQDWWDKDPTFFGTYDAAKAAWNAAIDEAFRLTGASELYDYAYRDVDALKTPLNTPTSPEQGQAKGAVAKQEWNPPTTQDCWRSSTAFDDQ